MIHHPNKNKNLVAFHTGEAPADVWPQSTWWRGRRFQKNWQQRNKRHLRAIEKDDRDPGPVVKPITSFTFKPGRSSRFCIFGRKPFHLYLSWPGRGYVRSYEAPCVCDACRRKATRVFKERPAKDVEAAKLRQFKQRRNNPPA